MYEDYLFPLNEIGFKTAKALHKKYVASNFDPENMFATKPNPHQYSDRELRAAKIIGRLHDRERQKISTGDSTLTNHNIRRYNAITGQANSMITNNTLHRILNHPEGAYRGGKEAHTKYIKPYLKGVDRTHIHVDMQDYPNETLAHAKAIARASRNMSMAQTNKGIGAEIMTRNAQQILNNQQFKNDYRDLQKSGDDSKALDIYYYMQPFGDWAMNTPTKYIRTR